MPRNPYAVSVQQADALLWLLARYEEIETRTDYHGWFVGPEHLRMWGVHLARQPAGNTTRSVSASFSRALRRLAARDLVARRCCVSLGVMERQRRTTDLQFLPDGRALAVALRAAGMVRPPYPWPDPWPELTA